MNDIEEYAENAEKLAEQYYEAYKQTQFHPEMSAKLKHSKWVQTSEMPAPRKVKKIEITENGLVKFYSSNDMRRKVIEVEAA